MNKNRVAGIILFLGDIGIFYFSLYLTLFIRASFQPDLNLYDKLKGPFFYLFFIWILILFIFDFYKIPFSRKKSEVFKNIILFFFFSSLVGTAYFYLLPELQVTPKTILFLTSLIATIMVVFLRYLFFLFYGKNNLREKVIIIGTCPEINEILEKDLKYFGYEIIAVFSKNNNISNKIKSIDNLLELKEEVKKADIVVLTSEIREDKNFVNKIFNSLPWQINYLNFSGFYENLTGKVPLYSVDELWFLENISQPRKTINLIIQRIIEIIISIIGIIVTIILYPFIALAIKIDSKGSVIYKQKRIGFGGKEFMFYKFRSMHDKSNNDLLWREKDQNEITRVGKFLRRTHLDELPQFYNLLKGDIGIVGPRPEWYKMAHIFEKEIPFYHLRYLVAPGITGWAQLHYPASTSIEEAKEKFKYDLYYIKNKSLFLDLVILLKTIRTMFN